MSNLFLYLVCVAFWGPTWLAITFQLGRVAAEASVAYRFMLAAALLLAYCLIGRLPMRYSVRDHGYIALQGLFLFALSYVMIYYAEQRLASGLVAVLFTAIIFFNIVGARVAFGQPIRREAVLGAAFGVVGLTLVFWPEVAQVSRTVRGITGVALTLTATVCASIGNLFAVRNQNVGLPVLQSNALGMAYGALFLVLFNLWLGKPLAFDCSFRYLASLGYLSIFGTVIAFGAYLTLVRRIGAGRASYVAVLIPIVALALSALFEVFAWHISTFVGIALCLAGNVIMLRPRTAPAAATAGVRS